jgi:hypothetical protein
VTAELHFNCWRSFNSLRNVRQMLNQTPRSSQSRSRRQHVEGCGNFLDPRTTALALFGRLGSKGAIFFHCASVSNGPHRAIGPPSALLTFLISHFGILNHSHFNGLFRVVQQLLAKMLSGANAFRISHHQLNPR